MFFTLLIATWHARADCVYCLSCSPSLFSAIGPLNRTLKAFPEVLLTLFLFCVIKLKSDNSRNRGELLRSRYVLRSRACYDVPNLKSARSAFSMLTKTSDFVVSFILFFLYNQYLKCETLKKQFFFF